LGKSLHASESEFVRTQSDDALVEFIKVGRQPDDPANTTGIAMPPKGGNPAITDGDLYNIVAWLRTLE
jgi:disulfide bond formation protein DsbB